MFLSPKVIPKKNLKLYAKKLLYSINLDISAVEKNSEVILSASGPVRFGPFSQTVYIETIYEKAESLKFKSHSFDLKEKLSFSYKLVDDILHLTSSKSDDSEKVEIVDKPWWDPLSLLLQIRSDFLNDSLATSYYSVTNQKFSEMIKKQDQKGVFFERKGRKQFYLLPGKKNSLIIEIEKLKVRIELSKTQP